MRYLSPYPFLVACYLSFAFPGLANATVTGRVICSGTCLVEDLKLTGQITANDVRQLQELLDGLHQTASAQRSQIILSMMRLSSPGGSINAAIAIGRLLRKEDIGAVVEVDDFCASACVLIFAGAVLRSHAANLGIHRPYLEVPAQQVRSADVKQTYVAMLANIRSYLREMNVTEGLADAMLRIPPEEVHFLSFEEADSYGLTVTDPLFQETLDLKRAQQLGISRQEYVRRNALAAQHCHYPGAGSSLAGIKTWNGCVQHTLITGHPSAEPTPDFGSYGTPAFNR